MELGYTITVITSRSVDICTYADDEKDVVSLFKGDEEDVELIDDFALSPCNKMFGITPLFEL